MKNKRYLLFFLLLLPVWLSAQMEKRVEGAYTYYTPQDVSLETAKATMSCFCKTDGTSVSVNSFCGMFHTQLQTCWANCAYGWSVDTLANDG